MPQYLLSVHGVEGEDYPTPEAREKAFADVGALNQKLQADGVWVFAGGLHPARTATVVRERGGELLTTDGPFIEGKEHIGGFWIIDVPDLDAALRWAEQATVACQGPVEVRPFQGGPED
jgi:hypothetical protein